MSLEFLFVLLILVFEMGSHYADQADLELISSWDPPNSVSGIPEITGTYHMPGFFLFLISLTSAVAFVV
jgi:hypothetical protein